VTLNAALEAESHGGPANDVRTSAQNLEGSFITLHSAGSAGSSPQPARGAVLGRIEDSSKADFYQFDLKAGQSATVQLTRSGGNSHVALLGPDGTTLALGRAGSVEGIPDFVAASTGTYYLRVTGDGGASYDLVVTRNAAFDTEPNSDLATAQDLIAPE